MSFLLLTITTLALCTTAVPSVPPPVGLNALQLQHAISSAVAQGLQQLTILPGEYVFSNNTLSITGARNLVLDAYGAVFVFYYGFGMHMNQCHNLTVRGLVLDSDPPNYAQGVVERLVNSTTIVAKFDMSFIPPDTASATSPFKHPGGLAGAKASFWDPKTKLVLPGSLNFMHSSTALGDAMWQVSFQHAMKSAGVVAGLTPVTIFPRRGETWNAVNSSQVLAEDVRIFAGGNMGFHESGGLGGHIYRRVRIMRKPGTSRLVALNADGFHSTDVATGPILEDSEISFTGDDFVNIHNRMMVTCKVLGDKSLAIIDVSKGGLGDLRAGHHLSFYQLLPGHVTTANPFLWTGTVTGSKRASDPQLLAECRAATKAMQQPPFNATLVVSFTNSPVFVVDFRSPLDPIVAQSPYNLCNFDERSGANAVVRRNHFHDSCGSGGRVIAKALNGSYTDNIIERFGGLHVYSEQQWLEGDLGLRNVLLGNNTIVDQAGGAPHFDVMQGLKNITCVDNTFVEHGTVTHLPSGCGRKLSSWIGV